MRYTKKLVYQKFNDLIAAFSDKLDAEGSWIHASSPSDSYGTRFEIVLSFHNGRHFEINACGAYTAAYTIRCVYETLDCLR